MSTGLTVLIVDDERPALDELRYLLEREEAIQTVASASSAAEAVDAMKMKRFDAVFLDIEMPAISGLDLARVINAQEPGRRPHVVFVTAFEQHALEAFEVEAVDYVLKPIRPERLAQAIKRIQAAARPSVPGDEPSPFGARFGVEVGGKTVFIERTSVIAVEASRDYVRLHTAERAYLVRSPISVLETAWAASGFVRVHRSFLIAIAHVRELRSDDSGTVLVVGDLEIPVSRTYARDLKHRLLSASKQPKHSHQS